MEPPPMEPGAIELLGRVRYGRLATTRRALPFLAVARHLVIDGHVVLRMHNALGRKESCDGSVVAYAVDNFNTADTGDAGGGDLWSVQLTGPAEVVHPTEEHRARFGATPLQVDGEPFEPVYLRLAPHFVTTHTLSRHASQPSHHTA
ncbi:pyridoxamine 5'-phosphate oxidase family protein [Streptomyces sp. JH14]|uniref:pyridoxamine 5'-phosphate oxidase family protein n=1 Tax=Streptomyces sp. JH14 TaxID=2793630 RepID=UPI0023F68E9D|nr:pyridoxamine 5'-phosphate oxidase family protein [Streptomyces sp. JH14]MDF6043670.1 pyridoxamine 5'-phosphate oxidase family protein [Streptomyces sp. JH14]